MTRHYHLLNAELVHPIEVMLFLKSGRFLKTAGCYIARQLQFQANNIKELLKVTIFCVDTRFHIFSPLINHAIPTLYWH